MTIFRLTKKQFEQFTLHKIAFELFQLLVVMTLSSTSIYVLSLGGIIFLCEGTAIVSAMTMQNTNGCIQIHQQALSLLIWYLKNNPYALGIPAGVVINITFKQFQKINGKRAAEVALSQE